MGERGVRNAEVEGSNPLPSTICNYSDLCDAKIEVVAPGRVWAREDGAGAGARPAGA